MDEQLAGSDSEPPSTHPRTVTLPVLELAIDAADGPLSESLPPLRSNAVPSRRHGRNGAAGPLGRNGAAGPILRVVQSVSPTPATRVASSAKPARHIISPRAVEFRREYFPDASRNEWNDWKWQLRSRLRDLKSLARIFKLTADEEETVRRLGGRLPVGITPHYAALFDPADAADPLRKMMVPVSTEFVQTHGEADDPLGEDAHMVVPGLVHRYPDRVLFLVTNFCATYCRYCTRARMVGQTGEYHFNNDQYQQALDYIEAHSQIRDVLISGGDPFTMMDERLEWLLSRLRAIKHVEFLRIGTKVPAVLPQRVTPELCRTLRRFHPLFVSIHFMHPNEVSAEVVQACERLADAGIPLGSQTVLSAGINDDVDTMKALVHKLLRARVRPYYLYQCDPISGSAHFRTPVAKGLEIVAGLRGYTTGYGVPNFVIDAPGGGGKIALLPEAVLGREGDDLLLRNYEGKTFRYPDPQ